MEQAERQGTVVAVTGASGRLGRHVVQQFSEQGATVAAVVHSEAAARPFSFDAAHPGAAFLIDTTDEAQVRAGFQQIYDRFGRLDGLVHTVGGWAAKPLLETSLQDWEQLTRLNLTSAFLCFREAVRLMQGRGGRLVGIAAAQGADRGRGSQGAYAAAKAGVIRLVEAVAAEFGGEGITAHAIAPSTILYDEEGRGVRAEHVAALCLYLFSPAGAGLNGATLRAYGSAPP